MKLETGHTTGRDAMRALVEARRKLYTPHSYKDPGSFGFTTVHSALPNPRIRRLTDTGTEQNPSLRIRDRKGERLLYDIGGFACSLKQASDGGYTAITSSAYYDLDGLPYGPEGYMLKSFSGVDIADPTATHPRDVRERLEDAEGDNFGYISYGKPEGGGVELAVQMAADISNLNRPNLVSRISEALSRKQ